MRDVIKVFMIIRLLELVIHMNHHAVISDSVSVEHAGRLKVALSFVNDNSVVVEVVGDAAMRAFCPSVVAYVKSVAGTVAVRTSKVVAAVWIPVGCKVGCAYNQSAESEIEAACRDGIVIISVGAYS